ncbi:hypothetical protein ACJX0J_025474, partial [Zea mays]
MRMKRYFDEHVSFNDDKNLMIGLMYAFPYTFNEGIVNFISSTSIIDLEIEEPKTYNSDLMEHRTLLTLYLPVFWS